MTHREIRHTTALAAALLSSCIAAGADAACTLGSEAGGVRKSLRQAMRCDYEDATLRARPGLHGDAGAAPAPARWRPTPTTSPTALAPLAEVDARALRDQLKCQRRIGTAVSHYVGTKLRYLVRGKTDGRGRSEGDQAASTSSPTTAP